MTNPLRLPSGTIGVLGISIFLACQTAPAPEAERGAPLFDDLGSHHMPITTSSPEAQRYFDQGLVLAYGFNHAESARSFREASRLDPDCAMCQWGIGLVLGPNINAPMNPDDVPEALAAAQKAHELAAGASEREQAYTAALLTRYSADAAADRHELDVAYARAMADVARAHPADLDAATLYAEALMDTHPWDYWDAEGKIRPDLVDLVPTLESVIERNPDHPGAHHLYIHAMEKLQPHKAVPSAERLADLTPGAGHLVHMPSHIYIRVGRYAEASEMNVRAAAADESYITQCRAQGFYPALYYPHNVHFLYAASSIEGRSEVAIGTARKLVGLVPVEALGQFPMLEEFHPIPYVALVRFGRWDEILAEPEPGKELLLTRGFWHYARGFAFVAKQDLEAAQGELAALREIARSDTIMKLQLASTARAEELLLIAQNVLQSELDRAEGRPQDQIRSLRIAAGLEDGLPYTEPPPWYQPVRQLLGAALLESGDAAGAEAVYREDLSVFPRNGWSLYGLELSLRAQGKAAEADEVRAQFEEAWSQADVTLSASRF